MHTRHSQNRAFEQDIYEKTYLDHRNTGQSDPIGTSLGRCRTNTQRETTGLLISRTTLNGSIDMMTMMTCFHYLTAGRTYIAPGRQVMYICLRVMATGTMACSLQYSLWHTT